MAQIRIDNSGKIGLRSTTTSSQDVFVNGTSLFNGSAYFTNSGYSSHLLMRVYNGTPQLLPSSTEIAEIGMAGLQFLNIRGKYHYATATLLTSDKRLKENFRSIEAPLKKIQGINGYKYDFKCTTNDTIVDVNGKMKKEYLNKDRLGFIAQDLKEILPEAVIYEEDEDLYYIDYNAVIPVIVEAMKEQNSQIENLKEEIQSLRNNSNDKSATLSSEILSENAIDNSPKLYQNVPNPFNSITKINFYLPESISDAKIIVFNMQGGFIESYSIKERGDSSIIIEKFSLEAGMYIYALIADGKEIDAKKMILTK